MVVTKFSTFGKTIPKKVEPIKTGATNGATSSTGITTPPKIGTGRGLIGSDLTTKLTEVKPTAIDTAEFVDTGSAYKAPVITPPATPTEGTGIKPPEPITTGTSTVGTTGITGATGEVTPDNRTFKDYDKDKNGLIDESEIGGDYKTFYDGLTDTEKKAFLAVGQNAMKNNLDVTEEYAKYMRDVDTVRSRTQQDEEYRKKQEALTGEYTDIQESQTLRRAAEGVESLKQSIAYLGSAGAPGTSAQRLSSLDGQIKEAKKTYSELVKMNQIVKSKRALGEENSAQQFERKMEDITTKLNDSVDKSIQDSYNALVAADNNGQFDTVSELEAFRDKMYRDLDSSITGFTDASISQLDFLIKRQDIALTEARTFEANNNKVNQDLSVVKGYYVNANGNPIYGADGSTIKIPTQIPKGYEPFVSNGKFFSPKLDASGELVLDENGSPIFNSTQLEDVVSVTSQLSNAYVDMVNKGVMTAEEAIKAVPELATNEAFIKGIEKAPEEFSPDRYKVVGDKIFDTKTQKYVTDIAESDSNMSDEESKLGQYTLSDGSVITASKGTVDGLNKVMATNPDIQFDLSNLYRTQEDQYRLFGQGRTPEELTAAGVPTEYSQPEKNIVTWTTNSSHMTGNAVDVVLPEGQDKIAYYNKLDAEMNKNGFHRPDETKARGDYGHYEYKGISKAISIEDLAFDMTSVLPRDLYKTDADFDRVVERTKSAVKELQKQGKEVNSQNVANILRGFSIKPEADKTFAYKMQEVLEKNAADTDRVDWTTVANFINKGDTASADKYVGNIIEKKAKGWYEDEFISTVDMNKTTKSTAKINELIKNNPDKIGLFDGTVTELMKKFKDYPEIQELQTLLTISQADTRKKFAGSAVTPTELKALEDYIGGNLKMTPNNLMTMLNTIKNVKEETFLGQRKQFGYIPLPKDNKGNIIQQDDEIDNEFFGAGEIDNTDLDFFNNLK